MFAFAWANILQLCISSPRLVRLSAWMTGESANERFEKKKKSKLIELGMLRLAIAYSSRKKPSLAHFRETESASHQERESDDGIVRFHIAAVSVPLSSRRLNGGAGARSFNKAQK
jgi:hypothetical protein